MNSTAPTLDRSAYENDSAKMLFAISRLSDGGRLNVYQGGVSVAERQKRRAANRVARATRRQNRK